MKRKKSYKAYFLLLALLGMALACTEASSIEVTPTTIPTFTFPTNTSSPAPTQTVPPTEEPAAPTAEAAAPTEGAVPNTSTILFSDDFSDPKSGWDNWTDTENFIGYSIYNNDKYEIALNKSGKYIWANPQKSFTDIVVEVQVEKITASDDVQMGIICRYQDIENWYALIMTADGFAAIRKRSTANGLETISDWTDTPSIQQGTATNQLKAECIGTKLVLYVNGELAVEATDADISAGDIGLLAGTFENASSIDVFFDDLVVSSP